ncbi:DUF2608 domain-containing protein [Candidatus Dependentiae bacterium]|nr:DUF2608 domain-containing protein [Candidatus Dependentiae bacterium]
MKNFKYPFLFFISIFLLSCSFCKSNIQEIDSFNHAMEKLNKSDEKTLIIFDMDSTLIAATESLFHFNDIEYFDKSNQDFIKQLHNNFKELAKTKKDPAFPFTIISEIFSKTDFTPVENKIINVIKDLQKKNLKFIALTASNTGKFYKIENMQKWRFDNLNQIGLDFSKSFDLQNAEFDNFPNRFGFFPPAFYKGILCSAGNPKGKILKAFIDKVNWIPNKVIFFDDNYKECKSVADEMNNSGIPVQCYWYRFVFKNKIKLNQEIMKYQFNHIAKYGEFLTEKEALEKMKLKTVNEIPENTSIQLKN